MQSGPSRGEESGTTLTSSSSHNNKSSHYNGNPPSSSSSSSSSPPGSFRQRVTDEKDGSSNVADGGNGRNTGHQQVNTVSATIPSNKNSSSSSSSSNNNNGGRSTAGATSMTTTTTATTSAGGSSLSPQASRQPSPPPASSSSGPNRNNNNNNNNNNHQQHHAFSDGLYKEELYRRLDEGIAATIVRRWDNAGGKTVTGIGGGGGGGTTTSSSNSSSSLSTTPVSKVSDSRSHASSSSIFEKYRDNLVAGGGHHHHNNNHYPNLTNSSSSTNVNNAGAGGGTALGYHSQQRPHSSSSPGSLEYRHASTGGGGGGGRTLGGGPTPLSSHNTLERTGGGAGGGMEKDHRYLVHSRSSGAATPPAHKADIHHLLSTDAEKFMDFTLSSPPNQQLLQLRVLELFQIWVSTTGVKEGIDKLLQDARRDVGLAPIAVQRAAWGEGLSSSHAPPSTAPVPSSGTEEDTEGGRRESGGLPSTIQASKESAKSDRLGSGEYPNPPGHHLTLSSTKNKEEKEEEEPLHPEELTGGGGGGGRRTGGSGNTSSLGGVGSRKLEALPQSTATATATTTTTTTTVGSSTTAASTSVAASSSPSPSSPPPPPPATTSTTSPASASSPPLAGATASAAASPARGTTTTTSSSPSPADGSPTPTPPPPTHEVEKEKDSRPAIVTLTKKALTQHKQQQQQQQQQQQKQQQEQQQTSTTVAAENKIGSAGGTTGTRGATYEEIPRFYFPLGKPTTREKVISGPLYKHHENPHLKFPSADVPSVLFGSEGSSGGGGLSGKINTSLRSTSTGSSSSSSTSGNNAKGVKGSGGGSKIPAMSTLRFADDRHVPSYIKKEFTRLNGPNRHQKSRMSSASRRSGASKEGQLRNHFHQCMQRICSQCFGVPRYFAFIIIGLIQGELCASEECSNLTGSVKGGLPFISPQCYNVITADHVQDFYEKYLRHKDTLRRTFDLLIVSSRLCTTTANGGTAGSMNGGDLDDGKRPNNSSSTTTLTAADPSTLRAHLIADDFKAYLLTLLCHHPGLAFLRQTPDFQLKYLDTVIYRIFYEIDRFDHGGISFAEFITSALMDAFRQVDATDDINSVLLFFSYEHFYVLYCRFWELDDDRDMLLSPQDLMRYAPDDAMNPLVVQRVFAGAGRRVRCGVKNRIGYEDFVWFCLSEEDKSTAPAIRYWFKVLDVDEDGVLSVYEIRNFYDTTTAKAAQYLQDNAVSFENAICQIFDMLRCEEYRGLTLSDLMAEPMASYVALNMMTSTVKFIQFEYKDPFVLHQDRHAGSMEQSPWDRFARIEYDRMAQEGDD